METAEVYDLYIPPQGVRGTIQPHSIITLPRSGGCELLLCYNSEQDKPAWAVGGANLCPVWRVVSGVCMFDWC